jgi:hypothetical protein
MNRYYLALLCSISVIFVYGVSYGQHGQMEGKGPAASWSGYEASWLIGHLVKSPDGSTLGQISDLVIDEANHKIALVLLSDVPGAGDRYIAVPYGALLREGGSTFELRFGDLEARIGPTSGYGDTYFRMMEAFPADLFGVRSEIEPNWVDFIHLSYGLQPYTTAMGTSPEAFDFHRFGAMIGAEVQLLERTAKVDDLIINYPDGHIAFVSVSGMPEKEAIAVPFSFLTRTEDDALALLATEDELAGAPAPGSGRDLADRAWAEGIYRHFGVQPYWEE